MEDLALRVVDYKKYQKWVWSGYGGKEMSQKEQFTNNIFGLVGEIGEVSDLGKKIYYLKRDIPKAEIVEELGDVLWHLTCLCSVFDTTLEEVMEANVLKLEARYPNGRP